MITTKKTLGFSIFEIIVTLVLLATAASIIIPFFRSGVTSSGEPAKNLETTAEFQAVMANMIADYNSNGTLDSMISSLGDGSYGQLNTVYTYTYNDYPCPSTCFSDFNATRVLVVTLTNAQLPGETLTHVFPEHH